MTKLCSFRVATVQHHAGAVLWRTVSRVRGVQQVVFTACRVLPIACRSMQQAKICLHAERSRLYVCNAIGYHLVYHRCTKNGLSCYASLHPDEVATCSCDHFSQLTVVYCHCIDVRAVRMTACQAWGCTDRLLGLLTSTEAQAC